MEKQYFSKQLALIALVLTLVFNIAYLLMVVNGLEPWTDIQTYAQRYHWIEFGPQTVGLLMLPVYLFLFQYLASSAPEAHQIWVKTGLKFLQGFFVLVMAVYFIQVAVVLPNLAAGKLEFLDQLVLANPDNLMVAVNYLGWGLLGPALLCFIPMFGRTKLERWIRILLWVGGISSILLDIGHILRNYFLQIPCIVFWLLGLPVLMVLFYLYFKVNKYAG